MIIRIFIPFSRPIPPSSSDGGADALHVWRPAALGCFQLPCAAGGLTRSGEVRGSTKKKGQGDGTRDM